MGRGPRIIRKKELEYYLLSSHLVYRLENGSFFSRAGLFTGKLFTIAPTKEEIQAGILIPGHRCMPFCDPGFFPHELTFRIHNEDIAKIPYILSTTNAFSRYFLVGEEYVYQYLAMDNPEYNQKLMYTDMGVHETVIITALDMGELFREWEFAPGDRLTARVEDWDKGIIELLPLLRSRENPFADSDMEGNREKWYEDLENLFLYTFDTIGPCSSIEEQTAYVFFLDRDTLFSAAAGSLEEFINRTEKIGIESYGVESRLWRRGETIPVAGLWSGMDDEQRLTPESVILSSGVISHEVVIEAYLLDSLYRKETSAENIMDRLLLVLPGLSGFPRSLVMQQVESKRKVFAASYNWFADYDNAKIRSRLLELYEALIWLIKRLERRNVSPENLPSQSFIILMQLIGHIMNILDAVNAMQPLSDEEINTLYSSIEGMEDSFSDTKDTIIEAVRKLKKNSFSSKFLL
ncbi:MAG: hypothetical protein LBR47_03060 [Spirochaetaceae bacterium]|nr:hypothetical protein [Spirochaetaceae bacterium]